MRQVVSLSLWAALISAHSVAVDAAPNYGAVFTACSPATLTPEGDVGWCDGPFFYVEWADRAMPDWFQLGAATLVAALLDGNRPLVSGILGEWGLPRQVRWGLSASMSSFVLLPPLDGFCDYGQVAPRRGSPTSQLFDPAWEPTALYENALSAQASQPDGSFWMDADPEQAVYGDTFHVFDDVAFRCFLQSDYGPGMLVIDLFPKPWTANEVSLRDVLGVTLGEAGPVFSDIFSYHSIYPLMTELPD